MILRQTMSQVLSKRLLVLGLGFAATALSHVARAESCGETVDAQGKVFYVIPDGDLVAREVTLTVPACGEGTVVLSSASGWRTETTTFWSNEVAGRKVFVVVFQNPKGDNPNHYLVLKGSYIRGKNAAKYWGDMYTLTLPEGQSGLMKDAQQFASQNMLTHYGRHAGGFGFKADVPQGQEPQTPAPQSPTYID